MFACFESSAEVGTVVPAAFTGLDRALLSIFQALRGCASSDSRPSSRTVSKLSTKSVIVHIRVSWFDGLQPIAPRDEHLDLFVHVRTLGKAANHKDILLEY